MKENQFHVWNVNRRIFFTRRKNRVLHTGFITEGSRKICGCFLSAKMSKIVIRISFLSRNESDIYSQSDSDFTMPSPVSLVYASYLLQNEEKSYSSMAYGMRFRRAGEGFRISCISRPSSKGATAHAIAVLQWLMLKKICSKGASRYGLPFLPYLKLMR